VLSRAVRVVTLLLLIELGVLVGGVGAFVHNVRATVGGLDVPCGLVAALCGSVGLFVLARRVLASRVGVAAAGAAWLVTALLGSVKRPEGDLVIANTVVGYIYLWGGAILAAVAVTLPTATLPAATPPRAVPTATLPSATQSAGPAIARGDGK